MPTQEIFRLDPGQTQHFRNLIEGQSLIAVALESQGFQGAAREVSPRGGKSFGHVIRNTELNFHVLKFNMRDSLIPSVKMHLNRVEQLRT